MTIPGAAAVLLLVAGLALGVLVVLVAAAAQSRRRSRPAAPPPPGPPDDDDLPGFLAAPPGSAGWQTTPRSGWAALSPAPAPPPAPIGPRPRTGRLALIAALAALVLLAASVAVIARSDTPRVARAARSAAPRTAPLPAVPTAPAPGDPGAGALAGAELPGVRHGLRADLTFAGIVLERRAVGVTAAYAHVRVSTENGASLAHVDLVTFNCLTDAAPRDPVAAGCSRVVPEYAELASPALHVTRSGAGGVTLRGRFPTYVRPNGTPAAWTGKVYELHIEVLPGTAGRVGVDVPATGFLQVGDDRAPTTAVSVLRLAR